MIKRIGLLLLVTVNVWAGDNCYVWPYGSVDWMKCKDQARDSQAQMDRIQAWGQQINQDSQAAQAQAQQAELERILQALRDDRK